VNGRVGSNTKRYRTMTEFDFVQALLGPIASGTTVSDLSINGRRPSGTTWEKDGRKVVMERGSGGGGGREGGRGRREKVLGWQYGGRDMEHGTTRNA
jgi:hypothetical protein